MHQVIPALLSLTFLATALREENAIAKLDDGLIDFQVEGASGEAFSALARTAELIILADPAIPGSGRIAVRSQTVRQVLEAVCRKFGCGWQLVGGVVHVFSGETPPASWPGGVLHLPATIEVRPSSSALSKSDEGASDTRGGTPCRGEEISFVTG